MPTQNLLRFATMCDTLRCDSEGEAVWQTLMAKAERIPIEQFGAIGNLNDILEDGETLDDYIAVDDWAGAYLVEGPERIAFLQRAGFEWFFTVDGKPPTLAQPVDEYAYEVMVEPLCRVLLKPNDARICGSFGYEGEIEEIDQDLDCVIGDAPRFRLHRDGVVVAGMRVENGVVEAIYVARELRREGLATELYNRVEAILGDLELSSVLTDDGKAFRNSLTEPEPMDHEPDEEGPSP